jgi:hypothetical protein
MRVTSMDYYPSVPSAMDIQEKRGGHEMNYMKFLEIILP